MGHTSPTGNMRIYAKSLDFFNLIHERKRSLISVEMSTALRTVLGAEMNDPDITDSTYLNVFSCDSFIYPFTQQINIYKVTTLWDTSGKKTGLLKIFPVET